MDHSTNSRMTWWSLWILMSGALAACSLSGFVPGVEGAPSTPTAISLPTAVPQTPTPGGEELLAAGIDAANGGDWQRAIALFDQVIALDPNNTQAYLQRGNAFLQLDDLTQAIADYNE